MDEFFVHQYTYGIIIQKKGGLNSVERQAVLGKHRRKPETLKSSQARENRSGFLFIAPMFVPFVVFTGIPVFITLFYLCFTQYNIMKPPTFVGLDNFIRMVSDPAAKQMAINVFRLPLYLVSAHTILGTLLAYLVYRTRSTLLKYITRSAIYFPVVVTTSSVAIAWGYLYNRDFGAINWILKQLGLIQEGIPWTTSSQYAMIAIVIFSLWKFVGMHFLYLLIGLQNIPETYYEASRIDGAGEFRVFFRITLPLLAPAIFYVVLTCMIGTMQCFEEPYFITKGGPGISTKTAAIYIYQTAFQSYEMGYASAIAAVLFLVVLAFTVIQLVMQKKWVNYDYD